MNKRYDSKEAELKWQKFWEKNKIFKFDTKSKKPIYSIDTPPPYASAGHLHVGHALHYTQFEFIARYKRMNGFNVYFPPCFDNNGLPTEKYVEEKFKISKKDVKRGEFRRLCRKESAKVEKAYGDRFFRKLGHSYDWNLLYTTIDPEAQKVAQKSFVELVKQKDCYRTEEPTLWCPYHQTALAQAEVEDLTRKTRLNNLYFNLVDSKEKIEIATTRPEFLPACVGVFVHPEDKRYKKLIGKEAIVPLFGQKVKIMTDEEVDKDFGSGILMVCTFGDKADIEKWKKYKLDLKICITKDGKLNELAGKYAGLNLIEGREEILKDLEKKGYLIKKEDLTQTVGVCWRCNTPIEFIVTKQWFILALKHKKELIKKGREIKWYPDFYRRRYEDWVKNLAWDWCISRQRFYGVPIPVWYCEKCEEVKLADEKELPVDPTEKKLKEKCKCGGNFIGEEDVFDTWMTSSMSPEIAVRWLEKPKQFKKMFPVSLRPQAQDIIRTWAFYTILKAHLHFNSIPWKDIALGTFVLDEHKKGMSKSKGNVVWTDDLLEKYDVDTIRYWIGNARWGTDLPFKEQELIAGRKFLNKLWNASKFSLIHLNDYGNKGKTSEIFDKWMLSKTNKLIRQVTKNFDNYNTGEGKRQVEWFFWHVFCDDYLEIIKDRLYNPDERGKAARKSGQAALYQSLLAILKMLAPIMPHITEEIYQAGFKKKEKDKSIHVSEWPSFEKTDEKSEKIGDLGVEIISIVRKFKSERQMSMKGEIKELVLVSKEKGFKIMIKGISDDLKAVLNINYIKFEGKTSLKSSRFKLKIGINL